MRIDVKKYLFVGADSEKSNFFMEAQKLGIVHFIDPKPTRPKEVPVEIQNTLAAIKTLNSLPVMKQEELDDYTFVNEVIENIVSLRDHLEKLSEDERILNLEIARVAPFGDYSKEEIEWIEKETNRTVQFYCAKQGHASSEQLPEAAIYITTESDLDYFIALNPKPTQFEKMIEIKPEGPLNDLEHCHRLLMKEIHDVDARLKNYARYRSYLHQALILKFNSHHLLTTEEQAALAMDGRLFVIEGWVPEDKVNALHSIAKYSHVQIEEVAIEPSDTIPTYLENIGAARIGEDLVHIYDTPSTSDKDPSLWVLFFFALFFSMIIGDAGYGLVLLAVALYFRTTLTKKSRAVSRFLNLAVILCGFCIVWGVLMTSFFGISFSPNSPVRKASLLTWLVEKKTEYHFRHQDAVAKEWTAKFPALEGMKAPKEIIMNAADVNPKTDAKSFALFNRFSDNILLELALFIGVVHISLSLIRNFYRNMTGIGWLLFIFGAYLYFPKFLGSVSMLNYIFGIDVNKGAENGLWLMFGGIGLAVTIAVIKDKFFGLLELMNVIQIFADAMSYLRLYALGLSGALVVSTMNDLASGLNVVLGGLLLVVAHIVNLGLCVMGGVIHGLRLNFLEWYHYSFEGGGKKFNPLKKIEVE
ncbi:MAG: V-type ATP synthase subunit I [Parachlamydiaceae bacterium]|nr:V-type ATP synthase subunit I [Parachlamydiaceae bacterium]